MHEPHIVGLIGLGLVGQALGERLRAQGWRTIGYDIREEARDAFEAALVSYRQQGWEEAEAGFSKCLAIDPEDGPSRVFVSRIAQTNPLATSPKNFPGDSPDTRSGLSPTPSPC